MFLIISLLLSSFHFPFFYFLLFFFSPFSSLLSRPFFHEFPFSPVLSFSQFSLFCSLFLPLFMFPSSVLFFPLLMAFLLFYTFLLSSLFPPVFCSFLFFKFGHVHVSSSFFLPVPHDLLSFSFLLLFSFSSLSGFLFFFSPFFPLIYHLTFLYAHPPSSPLLVFLFCSFLLIFISPVSFHLDISSLVSLNSVLCFYFLFFFSFFLTSFSFFLKDLWIVIGLK